MKQRDDDELFSKQAKRLFDESVEHVDAETRSLLNRGRQSALAEVRPKPAIGLLTAFAPAAGVAAAAVFAIALWSGNRPDDLAPPSTATDFEILLNEDSLEMLEELEFYSWIELEPDAGANVG